MGSFILRSASSRAPAVASMASPDLSVSLKLWVAPMSTPKPTRPAEQPLAHVASGKRFCPLDCLSSVPSINRVNWCGCSCNAMRTGRGQVTCKARTHSPQLA